MIINGSSRSNGLQLGGYLLDLFGRDKNENIEVLEVAHPEKHLVEALKQMQEITGSGQRGQKGLYHAQISPAIGEDLELSPAQWIRAADVLEQQMGLEGQARALVTHEKNGRIHLHAVWQRYDLDQGKLLSDSWDYIKHEKASRQLEEEFGHEPVPSPHLDKEKRSENSYEHGDKMQDERSKIDRVTLKQELTAAYQESDNGKAFINALSDKGFILAQGRHKSFSIVDENSTVYNPVRFIEDVKTKEFKAKFADIKRDDLPSVEEAKAIQREQNNTPTISQEGDRLARIQAGEKIQLLKDQQQEQKKLIRSQAKDLSHFDKDTKKEIEKLEQKEKSGVIGTFFLKITRRYDAREAQRLERHEGRIDKAALDRVDLLKDHKHIRREARVGHKEGRKELNHEQEKARQIFSEREQKIIKARIPEYQRQFTQSKKPEILEKTEKSEKPEAFVEKDYTHEDYERKPDKRGKSIDLSKYDSKPQTYVDEHGEIKPDHRGKSIDLDKLDSNARADTDEKAEEKPDRRGQSIDLEALQEKGKQQKEAEKNRSHDKEHERFKGDDRENEH
ncbi:MAG: relaxase/mobilization nuclease domain-containing protein [Oleispira sp.]|nr:relaxase/mobilization nuclease domain-containing protein [Oleispira sp.]